jgi:cytoskeletal protein CcmA (bactofilin family)
MPNSRISDLVEKQTLLSNGLDETADDDALVLLARAKSHNETIKYKNFKNSITDNSVYITGDQTVSGEKTFSDNAFFKSGVAIDGNLNVKGDIFNLKFETGTDVADPALLDWASGQTYVIDDEVRHNGQAWKSTGTTLGDDEPGVASIQSSATVTVIESSQIVSGDSIELTATDGTVVSFGEGSEWSVGGSNEATAQNIASIIDASSKFSATTVGAEVTITQATAGAAGNTALSLTISDPNPTIGSTDFSGGQGSAVSPWSLNTKQRVDQYLTELDSNLVTKGMLEVELDSLLKGSLTTQGATDIQSTLNVVNAATLQDTLSVSAKTTLSELQSTNSVQFDDVLSVTGKTTLGDLEVSGAINFANQLDVQGSTILLDTLDVTGDTTLSNLTVSGEATFDGNLLFSPGLVFQCASAKMDETLEVDGATTLNDTLTVKKDAIFEKSVSILENLTVKGDVFNIAFQTGVDPSTLAAYDSASNYTDGQQVSNDSKAWQKIGDQDAPDHSTPGAQAAEWQDVTLSTVTGKTDIDSSLEVQGDSQVDGTLTVAKATSLQDTLNVSQKTTLSELEVTGNASFASVDTSSLSTFGGIQTTGLADVNSLTSQGLITAKTDLNVEGAINVTGAASLLGALTVTTPPTPSPGQPAGTVLASLQMDGSTSLSGTLVVDEETTLSDTLGVNKATTLSDTLDVSGITTLSSQLNADGGIKVDSTKFVVDNGTGNVSTAGTLEVTQETTLTGATTVDGSLTLNSTVIASDTITANALLNADGGVSVNALMTVDKDSGNIVSDGTIYSKGKLSTDGGIAVDTDKFVVENDTGTVRTKGDIITDESATITKDLTVMGTLTASHVLETITRLPNIGEVIGGVQITKPEHPYSIGSKGDIIADTQFIFVCIEDSDGTDQNKKAWKRLPLSEW